jgi:hypothetical protein
MEHYLIKTKFPGFDRTLLALIRQDKSKENRIYYDLYQVGHFLGSIFPAISASGKLVWASMHKMDKHFVAMIGNQIHRESFNSVF